MRPSGSTGRSRDVYEVIAIGTSWGGLDAVSRLLDAMHADVHQPIIVAQHRGIDAEAGGLAPPPQSHTPPPPSDPHDKTPLRADHPLPRPPRHPPPPPARHP